MALFLSAVPGNFAPLYDTETCEIWNDKMAYF